MLGDPPAVGQLRSLRPKEIYQLEMGSVGMYGDMWGNPSLLGITFLRAATWICRPQSTMEDEKKHSTSTKGTKYPAQSPSLRTSEPGPMADVGS